MGETETGNAAESTVEQVDTAVATAQEGTGAGESSADTDKETVLTKADVDAAVEAARKTWEDQKAEEERLKKLSPTEREQEERKRTEDELAQLKMQLLQRDLKDKAVETLSKEKLPIGLADLLDLSSKEKMEVGLEKLTSTFKESLDAAVNARLRGKTPEGLGGSMANSETIRDQIAQNIRGGM